jgi:deazaflavin-dependent oxidoreductase (nitroreductase family)
MVVRTIGAKTNKVRNIPLIHVHKDDRPILVASLGGMPKNPSWYYNVKANPKVEVMTRNSHGTFIARQVSQEEKLLLWPIICETYPDYQTYQNNTDRDIPVFICDPA